MQRIKNLEEVTLQLKPLLRRYLEENQTLWRGSLFTCPNRGEHSNGDEKPSCGFLPNSEEQAYHCFACGKSGDIFSAYGLLEGKDINGSNWYVTVSELAEKYGIKCDLEPLLPEEQEFNNVQTFLKTLIKNANQYLVKNSPETVTKYIHNRLWEPCINFFDLGFLPDNQKVRDFIVKSFQTYPELSKHLSVNITRPEDFSSQLVNRLIYPIKHRYGHIIGIITRSVSDKDTRPKYIKYYLKSSEKGGVLYNLNKTFKTVYIVEGASSVFTLHANEIKNTVATLGTAFTDLMYASLVKNGIDKIILCFDGDEAGLAAIDKTLLLTQNKSDIKVAVKILPEGKDPDDIIKELGAVYFKNIPEISNFKYQLNKFKVVKDDEQEKVKKAIFEIIISNKDAITREKMLKMFTQETGILKTTLVEEIEKHEKNQGLITEVGVGEVLKEENILIHLIETFEERALRSGKLKGVSVGFPTFDEKMDGLQTGLILVAGKWNTGKSAFIHSIALNLLNDPTNYVLYFSIDDHVLGTTLPRFIANLSNIPINTISNPLHRIDKNDTLTDIEKFTLKNKRVEAIELLKKYSGRLGLKDSNDGYDTTFIEKIIKVYKVIANGKKLVVFVDFLNMVSLPRKNIDRTEIETQLASFFKHMAGLYDIPIICTAEGTKGVADTVMHEKNIKGSASLQFRSDLTLLLSSDFEETTKSEMYFYDDAGIANPIVRVHVSKNKFSSFKKSIYFKFYRDCSKFVECTSQEQLEYSRKG